MSPSHLCAECHTKHDNASGLSLGRTIVNWVVVAAFTLGAWSKGGTAAGVIGWAILIGGWFLIAHHRKPKCPACGCRRALPIDSPAAKKITGG